MTVVQGALRGGVAPDVTEITMTTSLVKLIGGGKSVKVGDLQEKLNGIWDAAQIQKNQKVMCTAIVTPTPRYENKKFP